MIKKENNTYNIFIRRTFWPNDPSWVQLNNGSYFLAKKYNTLIYHIIIFQCRYGQWTFKLTIENPNFKDSEEWISAKWFDHLFTAKLAVFDMFFSLSLLEDE